MEKEEWLEVTCVENYEGLYLISNNGRLISKRYGNYKTPSVDKDGYLRYHLYLNGKQKVVHAHRLVLLTFLGHNPDKQIVDHIDGVRDNNALSNLRWCTVTENNRWGNNSKKVMVKSKETGRVKKFLSTSEASQYYGYNISYFTNIQSKMNGENNKFIIKYI